MHLAVHIKVTSNKIYILRALSSSSLLTIYIQKDRWIYTPLSVTRAVTIHLSLISRRSSSGYQPPSHYLINEYRAANVPVRQLCYYHAGWRWWGVAPRGVGDWHTHRCAGNLILSFSSHRQCPRVHPGELRIIQNIHTWNRVTLYFPW